MGKNVFRSKFMTLQCLLLAAVVHLSFASLGAGQGVVLEKEGAPPILTKTEVEAHSTRRTQVAGSDLPIKIDIQKLNIIRGRRRKYHPMTVNRRRPGGRMMMKRDQKPSAKSTSSKSSSESGDGPIKGSTKSSSSKSGGGSKSSSSKSAGSKSSKSKKVSKQCTPYDFRGHQPSGKGSSGKGGKGGNGYREPNLTQMSKLDDGSLNSAFDSSMFQGENCDPNVIEVASRNPMLSTFVQLIEAAGLEFIFSCPGPFTALVPTNAAFAMLDQELLARLMSDREFLEAVLLYHVLPGVYYSYRVEEGSIETLQGEDVEVFLDPFRFNDGVVSPTDTLACNGVIQVIDEVLVPPSLEPPVPDFCDMFEFLETGRRRLQDEGELCEPNILETARQDPMLSTFVTLIETAGLEDIFLCAGPFTALIPVNEAFADLDPALLEFLMDPANADELREVLLYHFFGGVELSTELVAGPLITLQGDPVTVEVDPIQFNGEGLIEADIPACNGIIDKIDGVLFPPGFGPPTDTPTVAPVLGISNAPSISVAPSAVPSSGPSISSAPSNSPIAGSMAPSTSAAPSTLPSIAPSVSSEPSNAPIMGSMSPSVSSAPSALPSLSPSTSMVPSQLPSLGPSSSVSPSSAPIQGSMSPSISSVPSLQPSTQPSTSAAPSLVPSTVPTVSLVPSSQPSMGPSQSASPSRLPSVVPTVSASPSSLPSSTPSSSVAPSQTPSTQGPTATPTIQLQRIRARDYFLAYGCPGLSTEPSTEDLNALLDATDMFWTSYFQDFYMNQPDVDFIGLNLNPEMILFEPNFPSEPTLNYYIDFDSVFLYELDSATPPDAEETFMIMANADLQDYLVNFVRPIATFALCDEVLFEAVEFLVPALRPGNHTLGGRALLVT